MRVIIVVVVAAAVIFLLKMAGFADKKVFEFDRAATSRQDAVEKALK